MLKKLLQVGPAFIVLAAILWGLDGILRRSLFSLSPISIVFYEHLIGALILLPFFAKIVFKERKLTKREWGAIGLVSLLSGVLGTLWFTAALAKTNFIPFSVVFLLQKLQPIFTVAVAILVLKEQVSKKYIGWAILALAAAYFVTFPTGVVDLSAGTGQAMAALLALGAAFAWGSSTAFSRFTLLNHSITFITSLRFFLTTIISFGFVLAMGEWAALSLPTAGQFGRLLIIALSTGMVALWIYYQGLKYTQAKVSTILELVFPLTAVIIDYFLYDTTLSLSQYFAAVVLLFAALQVSKLNQSVV